MSLCLSFSTIFDPVKALNMAVCNHVVKTKLMFKYNTDTKYQNTFAVLL